MKDNRKRWWIALAVLFVIFTVVAFAAPFAKTSVFAISYLFGVIAIAAQIYVIRTAFYCGKDVKSKFYGFPLARIGALYLAGQLIASLLFMALAAVMPIWLSLIIFVVLLGAAAIGMITAEAVRDEVVRQDTNVVKDTSFIPSLRRRVDEIKDLCQDPELSKQLIKLSDEIRYSDPVSSAALAEVEHELDVSVIELRAAVTDGDNAALDLCAEVRKLLAVRNNLCKDSKRIGKN